KKKKREFHFRLPKFPSSCGCQGSWADLRQIPQPECCKEAQPTGTKMTMPAAPDHPTQGRQPQPPAAEELSR
ncbi:hypothetical protein QBC45DRAFT_314394, partial [Copromyces sp. CBS 386.78]